MTCSSLPPCVRAASSSSRLQAKVLKDECAAVLRRQVMSPDDMKVFNTLSLVVDEVEEQLNNAKVSAGRAWLALARPPTPCAGGGRGWLSPPAAYCYWRWCCYFLACRLLVLLLVLQIEKEMSMVDNSVMRQWERLAQSIEALESAISDMTAEHEADRKRVVQGAVSRPCGRAPPPCRRAHGQLPA